MIVATAIYPLAHASPKTEEPYLKTTSVERIA
jgi:hypothetical protein